MKKKMVKNLSLAMALVTCTTMSIPAIAQVGVFAATPSCGVVTNYLQMPNFKNSGSVDTEYVFEEFTMQNQSGDVEVSVKDPYGKEVPLDKSGDTPKFTPDIAGTYVATFTVNGVGTNFEIEIEGLAKDYTLSLPSNSSKILPAKVGLKDKDNKATEIAFPDAVVFDKNGEAVDIEAEGLEVVVKQPTATNSAQVNWNETTKTLIIDTNIEKTATYKVVYELYKQTKLLAIETVEIVAEKDFKISDYKYRYVGTQPTTADIGVETTLPSVSATSKADDSEVKVYYSIKVQHNGQDVSSSVLKQNDKGEYIFIANAEGNFVVTYDIEDFAHRAPSTDSTSFTISDVSDNTAPTPIVTLPYDAEQGTDVDAIEAFQEVQTNTDIMILPIYAEDKANGYVEGNLTLYRQIVKKSNDQVVFDESKYAENNEYANKALVFNASENFSSCDVYVNGVATQITTNQMHAVEEYNNGSLELLDGTYIVKYIAKDKLSGKQAVTLSLPLEISTSYKPINVTKTPKVEFAKSTVIPNSAQLGEVITFKLPTATQESDGVFTDTHLSTYITYQLSTDKNEWSPVTPIRYDAADSWIVLNEDKTEYTLTIPEWDEIKDSGYKYIKVIANSMNDAEIRGTTETIITLVGAGDDAATSVSDYDCDVSSTNKVGNQATLPSVIYIDDMPNHVNVQILIEGEDGKTYSAQNLVRKVSGTTITVSDAYFIPEEEGAYTVTYISTDAGNNKTVMVFNMVVGANPALFEANFVNVPSSINGGTAELGEKIHLPNISTYVSSEDYLDASDWRLEVVGPADYETDLKTYIKFNKVGDYTLKFISEVTYKQDIDGHAANTLFDTIETKTYTVTVSDTKGPEVLNPTEMEKDFFELNQEGPLLKGKILKLGENLPMPQAKDVVWEKSTLAIVATGSTENFTLDAEGIAKLTSPGVTLSKDAVYQFIYTLTDINGNTTLIDNYTVDVGDVEPPELNVEEGVVSKTYKPHSTVKVVMSKITASDNQDGENLIYQDASGKYKLKVDECELNITVKNTATGETISAGDYDKENLAFEFEDIATGEYTLCVSLTDSSGKTATNNEIKFTVTEAAAEAATGEDVLGVALIVVSVLMLGGVITYFVVTRKKYSKWN